MHEPIRDVPKTRVRMWSPPYTKWVAAKPVPTDTKIEITDAIRGSPLLNTKRRIKITMLSERVEMSPISVYAEVELLWLWKAVPE